MRAGAESDAVVLLSGGADSQTALAVARDDGCRCRCLGVDYGQRASALELAAARRIAESMDSEFRLMKVDLADAGVSTLLDATADLSPDASKAVPDTYVPARNTMLLALAASWAESVDARRIYIGANAVDYSGYPDCRAEYLQSFQRLLEVGTRAGVAGRAARVHAPLLERSKADILRLGVALGVDYGLSVSCYAPPAVGRGCGVCDSCALRRAAFAEIGVRDPVRYNDGV